MLELKNTSRNFGIEIECIGPINDEHTPIVLFPKHKIENWQPVGDGSIQHFNSDVERSYEFVSPILQGINGIQNIETFLKMLESNWYHANSTCGLHVHVDISDLSSTEIVNVIIAYAKHEHTIDSWVHPARRTNNNTYCRSIVQFVKDLESQDWSSVPKRDLSIFSDVFNTRFSKLNLSAIRKHGTVEFRQFHGSVNPDEIIPWIVFCLNFLEEFRHKSNASNNINDLYQTNTKQKKIQVQPSSLEIW